MSINLVLEPYCDGCRYFEPDHVVVPLNDGTYEHKIYCKYNHMCRHAVQTAEIKKDNGV